MFYIFNVDVSMTLFATLSNTGWAYREEVNGLSVYVTLALQLAGHLSRV